MKLETPRGVFVARPAAVGECVTVGTIARDTADYLAAWYEDWLNQLIALYHTGNPGRPGAIHAIAGLPSPQVRRSEHPVYGWRITMPTSAWAAFTAETAETVDVDPSYDEDVEEAAARRREFQQLLVWTIILGLTAAVLAYYWFT